MMNTGYRQWLRRWRIIVYPQDGGTGIDVSYLRCVFKIEKNLNETPNYSQIAITNPALSTIENIKPGDKVTVEAGYENGNYGLIFAGDVVQPYVERDGAVDTNLILVCQDGDVFLNSAFTAMTLEKGSTSQDVINACAKGDGITQGIITEKLAERSPFIRGKVLFGKSADYLRSAARTVNGQFYLEDGVINIIAADDYQPGEAVELTPDTGLIGDPSQTDDGVSVKCLINPSIKLNTLVHVSSDTVKRKMVSKEGDTVPELDVDGLYRAIKISYSGDTHGDDWYCTIDALTNTPVVESGNGNGSGKSGGNVNTYTTGENEKRKSVAKDIYENIFK